MKNFYNLAQLCLLAPVLVGSQSQYTYNYDQVRTVRQSESVVTSPQYQYGGGRRQDVLQGQFVDVRQQQQFEEEAELLEDAPVPVVIKGQLNTFRHLLLNITIITFARSPSSPQ